QVVDILEPDVEANRRPARHPFRRRPNAGAIEWNGQALEAAPRSANAEQIERVDERVHRILRDRLEDDAEQSARTGKIAPPNSMARTALERWMQHAGDFRARGEPMRHLQSRLVVVCKPHAHGAQPAQAEIDVVRSDAKTQRVHRLAQALPSRLVGRY